MVWIRFRKTNQGWSKLKEIVGFIYIFFTDYNPLLLQWIYIETRNLPYPLTICIRFVYNYEQISEVLRGAHGFIVVYNPHSDFQSILRKIAEVVRIQSRYSYLPVVSVASKFCSPEQTNPQILQSCLHVVIDFEEPISNKQSTVSA